MNRTRVVGPAAAVVALGAILLSGCGTSGRSSCAAPPSSPATLSGNDRRDPLIASDGGGGMVAIWESLTGGPVEGSVHTTDTWSTAAPLSGRYARFPSVAVSPNGAAIVTWQLPFSAHTTTVQVTTRDTGGMWSAPVDVSPPGTHAREPRLALTGDGTALLVWRRDTGGGDTVIEATERPPGGQWSPPRGLSDPTVRAKRPRLAIAPNGAAALVWEQTVDGRLTVVAATRDPDGRWTDPVTLTGATAAGHEPNVAIGPTGTATVVWIEETSGGAAVMAASRTAGGVWPAPVVIGRGSALPHETPRPGRAETGADVAALPDGRIAAVWTIVDGTTNRAQAAVTRPDGTWTAATALSKPGAAASGVQVVALAGGDAAAGWEELDGGLIRARVARLAQDGSVSLCTDVTAAVAESGAVRLVGGSAPTAVFVDLNRSRVQVAPIP